MIDESESGEAYDKIANQPEQLAPIHSRPTRRKRKLSIELEARLVRTAMSGRLNLNELAEELGITPSKVTSYLKQLGLEKTIQRVQTSRARITNRSRKIRRILTH